MKKKIMVCSLVLWIVAFMIIPSYLTASNSNALIRMRLYEGFRVNNSGPASVVSSYYLKPLSTDEVTSESVLAKEQQGIRRVFNLKRIRLMSEAVLEIPKGESHLSQVIVLNGRDLVVRLSATAQENKFQADVLDKSENSRSLLSSKIVLPENKSTILGFEDSVGKIYFLTFNRKQDVASGKKMGKNTGVVEAEPVIIKKVVPKYPEVAKKAGIAGVVILDCITDINGNVVSAMVRGGHPLLRQAAYEAVIQWKYNPYIVNGKACSVKFTVQVRFNLTKKDTSKDREVVNLSSKEQPKLLKKIEPKYPPEALKKRITGTVVIEATTDTEGNVANAIVLEGVEELNEAALTAIKQWIYTPYILEGEKKAVRFTVSVRFNLNPDKKKAVPKK